MEILKRFIRVTLLMLVIVSVIGKSPHSVEAHINEVSGWTLAVADKHSGKYGAYISWFECDKKRSSTATTIWYTLGYRITMQPIGYPYNVDSAVGFDYYYKWYGPEGHHPYGAQVRGNVESSAIKDEYNDQVHNTNKIDTVHGLSAVTLKNKYYELMQAYPQLVYKENDKVYVFLQPIIGVADKGSGGKYTTRKQPDGYVKQYRTLSAWKNAADWANTKSFVNHYNKRIPMSGILTIPGNVEYQTYSNGTYADDKPYGAGTEIKTGVEFSATPGSSKKLSDCGYTAAINKNNTSFKLVGVRIYNNNNEIGSVRLEKPASNNLYYETQTYGIAASSGLANHTGNVGKRVQLTKYSNGFTQALTSSATFTVPSSATSLKVVYLYSQVATNATLYFQPIYHGVPDVNPSAGASTKVTTTAEGKSFSENFTEKVQYQTAGKMIANRSGKLVDTVYVPFKYTLSINGYLDKNKTGIGNSTWKGANAHTVTALKTGVYSKNTCTSTSAFTNIKSDITDNAKAEFVSKGYDKKYVFSPHYRAASPVIVLKYFKKADNSKTLFYAGTVTSNSGSTAEFSKEGKFDGIDASYVKTAFYTDEVTASSENYYSNRVIGYGESRTANMHLTESYVVDLDSRSAIKGWGGCTSNCWTKDALQGTVNHSNKRRPLTYRTNDDTITKSFLLF